MRCCVRDCCHFNLTEPHQSSPLRLLISCTSFFLLNITNGFNPPQPNLSHLHNPVLGKTLNNNLLLSEFIRFFLLYCLFNDFGASVIWINSTLNRCSGSASGLSVMIVAGNKIVFLRVSFFVH